MGRRGDFQLERRFALVHPATMMAFFASAVVLTLLSYHPLILGLSFVLAAVSVALYLGLKTLWQSLLWLIPMAAIVVLFNTLFNRRGATELVTVGQYTFTFESLLFGLCIAMMLAAVILWFRLYQEFMTSDRFLYLFAPLAPTMALSIAMVQRWIPLTKYRWQQIRSANKMMSGAGVENVHTKDESQAHAKRQPSLKTFRSLTRSLSALMSWSMEDAIEAADSMQARGYDSGRSEYCKDNGDSGNGNGSSSVDDGCQNKGKRKRRSSFRSYRLTTHDGISLAIITKLALAAGLGIFLSTRELAFFPIFRGAENLPLPALIAATLIMLYPLFIEGKEQLRWFLSAQKT